MRPPQPAISFVLALLLLLATPLVVPAFKSPIPEHPKFSRPKALSSLPADASFTFCLLGHSANPTCITLHPSTIPNRPTSSQSPLPQDALLDYTAPPSLVLSTCTRVLSLLSFTACQPALQSAPGSHHKHPKRRTAGEEGGAEAPWSPLTAGLRAQSRHSRILP